MKFKHKITGIVEDVTNPAIIPQYQKHSDTYEQVKGKGKKKGEETPETPENEESPETEETPETDASK